MHILFVCHEYPPTVAGGIGTAVATMARGLVKAGHRASVVGYYPKESIEDDAGVTVRRWGVPLPKYLPIPSWHARRALRRQIMELHAKDPVDIIEWPDYMGWYWKPIRGVVDIVKVHGTQMSHYIHGFTKEHSRMLEYLELRTLRNIPYWIGVSGWFNEEWKRIASAKPKLETVVYNPVNTNIFVPPTTPRTPGLILYVGGFRVRKGTLALAEAAKIFLQKIPGSRLVLMGYPSDLTKERLLAAAGPAASQIEFLPFQDQTAVARHMASASLYVMPSHYESCGNSWIEAMSCETPVVGSLLSCGPEIVADGETGLLSDPTNAKDIADKVITILSNPDLAQTLGKNGRQRALEKFSLAVGLRTSLAFYQRCLNDRFPGTTSVGLRPQAGVNCRV